MAITDARIYQILFLSLFLLVGFATRDWTLRPGMIVTAIATCLVTQGLLATWQRGSQVETAVSPAPDGRGVIAGQFSWPAIFSALGSLVSGISLSPLITSLSLSLLLRADHYSTMGLAAGCAIASKKLASFRGKHLFNPANFGIIVALTLTPDAWVSPGQWGEEGWYVLLFLTAGGIVLQRVGRWDTTLAFLVTYAGLEAARNLWLGWTWDVWSHRLMNGSLLLFALFMITDPRTIPNARSARLLWAGAIALVTFVLRNVFFIPTAVFWALFLLAPLTPLLDWLWPAERFTWRPPSSLSGPGVSAVLSEPPV